MKAYLQVAPFLGLGMFLLMHGPSAIPSPIHTLFLEGSLLVFLNMFGKVA